MISFWVNNKLSDDINSLTRVILTDEFVGELECVSLCVDKSKKDDQRNGSNSSR